MFFSYIQFVFGEGNGTPLQYSCLENPRDGGAWWAAIYGVTQSQTRLKQAAAACSICVNLPNELLIITYIVFYNSWVSILQFSNLF